MSAALAGWGIKANILFAISITSDKPWDQGFRVLDKSLNRRSLRAREKKKILDVHVKSTVSKMHFYALTLMHFCTKNYQYTEIHRKGCLISKHCSVAMLDEPGSEFQRQHREMRDR